MILKLKGNSTWTLFDNITGVNHCVVTDQEALDFVRSYAESDYTSEDKFDKNKPIILLTYFTKDSTVSILAYQPIFILNDSGQTIDRI